MKDNKGLPIAIIAAVAVIFGIVAQNSQSSALESLGKTVIGVFIAVAVVVAIIVVVVLYFAFRDRIGTKSTKSSAPELDRDESAIIKNGYSQLTELRRTTSRLADKPIHESAQQICSQVEKILVTLREKPETLSKARPFLNYYLPTFGKIIGKYLETERGGVADSALSESVAKCLDDIRIATEKQYRNLFDADILDLTAEIRVMNAICKRDGLLDESGSDDGNVNKL